MDVTRIAGLRQLDRFDGPPPVTKVVVLTPHTDSKTQAVLDKIFKFDRYVGALGLIPSGISRLIAKAVNPSNSKAGRLAEKAHISKLSHVIFTSAFGMWMERKRREIAWKTRDKVDSNLNRNSSIDGKQTASKDGRAQLGVRRSARILERKTRAANSAHDHTVVPDGNNDSNRSPPRSPPGPISVWHGLSLDAHSATQLASCQSQPGTPSKAQVTRADPVDSARRLTAVVGNVAIIRCYMHIRLERWLLCQFYGDLNYSIIAATERYYSKYCWFFQFYGDQNILCFAATERY